MLTENTVTTKEYNTSIGRVLVNVLEVIISKYTFSKLHYKWSQSMWQVKASSLRVDKM